MLGAAHVLILLLVALGIVFLLHYVQMLPSARARQTICIAAMLVPALELTHSIWLYATGVSELVQLLPLHLCGIQSLFIPLAVFTRRTCFEDFVYATALLGGVFGILFPAGVAGYYEVLSFQTIQTVLLHMLLIFIPLALVRTGAHLPSVQRFPRVLCIFFAVALVVGTVDRIFGENYMFLYEAPAGTPLVWIFNTFGRPVYLVVTFLLLAGVSLLIHLPFALRQRKAARVKQQA